MALKGTLCDAITSDTQLPLNHLSVNYVNISIVNVHQPGSHLVNGGIITNCTECFSISIYLQQSYSRKTCRCQNCGYHNFRPRLFCNNSFARDWSR